MTNRPSVENSLIIDFGDAVRPDFLAGILGKAFEMNGGFEKLAENLKVRLSIGMRFADAGVKKQAMAAMGKVRIFAPEKLSFYEMDEVDDKALATIMEGTLAACLQASADAFKSVDTGIDLFGQFQESHEGKVLKPEVVAFYNWMDAKVNGNVQPPSNS